MVATVATEISDISRAVLQPGRRGGETNGENPAADKETRDAERAGGPPGVLVAPAPPDGNQHGEPVALLRKGA